MGYNLDLIFRSSLFPHQVTFGHTVYHSNRNLLGQGTKRRKDREGRKNGKKEERKRKEL